MSNPVEECKDEDLPANTLEHFTELQQVLEMIENIKSIAARTFEREFEQYAQVLSRYQEQPHLLDPHLEELLGKLLQKIRRPDLDEGERHGAFKYLYIICKVRTYKVMVKFMPHELSDLEFVLDLLGQQDPKEFEQWETRYILLLWMSILVLNPFHMARLDAYETAPNDTINSMGVAQGLPKELVDGMGDALLKLPVLVVDGRIRRILQLLLEVLQARSKRLI